jgi:chemotaxis protein histidine kinase CheA
MLDQTLGGDDRKLGEILVSKGASHPADVEVALETQSEGRRSVADSSIRVDVDLLDALMTLVGELVLTRNQIVQHASSRADTDLVRSSQRLNLIASELQEGVMKTRMQPIDSIWGKVPRVVRDLSLTCGKTVRVEMEGKETELDRTILESTKDPLTHLVRNAVDHAIETPRSGSPPARTLRACCCCAPSTRAARSTSRSPTTARASTPRSSAPRRSSAAWSPATSSAG